jgi:hypothetical protein
VKVAAPDAVALGKGIRAAVARSRSAAAADRFRPRAGLVSWADRTGAGRAGRGRADLRSAGRSGTATRLGTRRQYLMTENAVPAAIPTEDRPGPAA